MEETAKVRLSGAGSTGFAKDTAVFLWYQLDGPQTKLSNPAAVTPVFTAPEAGVNGEPLSFQLSVTDQGGLRAKDTCIVNVTSENHPPKADAGSDLAVQAGAAVTLDGSKSFDPDGNIVSYRWSQLAGQPVDLSDPTAAQTSFTAPSVGSEVVVLVFLLLVTVSDGLQDKQKVEVKVALASAAMLVN